MSLRIPFSLTGEWLICDVLVWFTNKVAQAAIASGRQPPKPARCRGLIDTGCNATAVNPDVISSLGVQPSAVSTTQTASAQPSVRLFDISLTVFDAANPSALLTAPYLRIVELTQPLTDVDLLIGMDVIRTCNFHVDGPAGVFSLEW